MKQILRKLGNISPEIQLLNVLDSTSLYYYIFFFFSSVITLNILLIVYISVIGLVVESLIIPNSYPKIVKVIAVFWLLKNVFIEF